ncbi:MAG: YidC/Oxa1 family membrane protein insertase [Clostridiaceae bacterium]|nr:YidC/Oxa1 family membrane protein insertase [Clostridiaceae bacterium]
MFNFLYKLISTPFGYAMRWIFQLVGSYGWSIILFSLLAKLLTLPLTFKQKRDMMATQALQPKIQKIQKTYGKDKQRMNEELQNLYDQEGVSPMSGCGSTLIIFPIMIGLYGVISQPLTYFMQLTSDEIAKIAERLNYVISGNAYTSQIGLAGMLHDNFAKVADISEKLLKVDFNFGPLNLAATPSLHEFNALWIIPVLSCLTALGMSLVTQYYNKKNNPVQTQMPGQKQSNMMMYILTPAMSLYFSFVLPAGLGIYWIANNVFTAIQEAVLSNIMYKKKKTPSKTSESDE